jgi:hypothetical protein
MESPQAAAQSGEHLVTRDELYFTAVYLTHAAFDFCAPRFFDVGIRRSVEGLDQGKREVRTLRVGQLGCLFL